MSTPYVGTVIFTDKDFEDILAEYNEMFPKNRIDPRGFVGRSEVQSFIYDRLKHARTDIIKAIAELEILQELA